MNWILIIMLLPLAGLLYWAGFYATKDMRIKKNAIRTEQAKNNLAQQKLDQQADKDQ
ncbi:MAG: hypothetical protein R8K49_03670 [Mariprofundaceae bacterium]